MRIVSLLPSATEIVCSLGLIDSLVGVTHECDYPPEVKGKPVLTRSLIDTAQDSYSIDRQVVESLHEHRTLYALDEELLRELSPDLILTQELCDVCAVSYTVVEKAARILPAETPVVSLEPNTLYDILETILLVGRLTGTEARAQKLIDEMITRIRAVESKASSAAHKPKVYCMEWVNPPYKSGHWIPEMVRLAGGEEIFDLEGVPSSRASWEEIAQAAPEVIVVMACGFDADRTEQELMLINEREEWQLLPAVRNGNVWVSNGSAYFARPGPRIVDSLEMLAHAIHPELFPEPDRNQFRRFRPLAAASPA